MRKDELTKKEALELITPVVDGEIDEDTRIAFLVYIQKDKEVHAKYESIKRVKQVLATRCPCAKAPNRLKQRIQTFLETSCNKHESPPFDNIGKEFQESIYDKPCTSAVGSDYLNPVLQKTQLWKYATVLLILGVSIAVTYFFAVRPFKKYNLEQSVYAHFIQHNGRLIQPTIVTASLTNAEVKLARSFDMPMRIPPLKNATFKGVVYSDFVPNFKTPMLEYYLDAEDQYVYIFAFKIDKLKQFGELYRSPKAVESCIKEKDFHVQNIKGKNVVSWRWNGIWYAAISNHDGKTLASLVEPLNFTK